MIEDTWEPPTTYWMLHFGECAIRVHADVAKKVISAKDAEVESLEVEDIYGSVIVVYPRFLFIAYSTCERDRDRANMHLEARTLRETEVRKAYRQSLGIFDTD